MQTVKFEFNGRPYCLCFNGAALFAVQEKFGDGFNAGSILAGTGTEGFSSLCWLLAQLAEQGELVRRYMGYDPQDIPTPEYFEASLGPLDTLRAKKAVLDAFRLGFAREIKDKRGIDIYELEYQKKTGSD